MQLISYFLSRVLLICSNLVYEIYFPSHSSPARSLSRDQTPEDSTILRYSPSLVPPSPHNSQHTPHDRRKQQQPGSNPRNDKKLRPSIRTHPDLSTIFINRPRPFHRHSSSNRTRNPQRHKRHPIRYDIQNRTQSAREKYTGYRCE